MQLDEVGIILLELAALLLSTVSTTPSVGTSKSTFPSSSSFGFEEDFLLGRFDCSDEHLQGGNMSLKRRVSPDWAHRNSFGGPSANLFWVKMVC